MDRLFLCKAQKEWQVRAMGVEKLTKKPNQLAHVNRF